MSVWLEGQFVAGVRPWSHILSLVPHGGAALVANLQIGKLANDPIGFAVKA